MSAAPALRRRHVFFIAGFDPKSARWYHALYRTQARRQAAAGGLALDIDRGRSRPCPVSTAWTIRASTPAGEVRTVYELLQWDDIVRAHWAGSGTRVLIDGLRSVTHCFRDGAVQRMFRLFRPPVYATLLPLALLAACAVLALAIATAVALGLRAAGWLEQPLQIAAAAFAGAALFAIGVQGVQRIRITWLLRLVHFTVLHATGRAGGIEERMDAFASRIADVACAGSDAPDEVLVVGHSVGATLGLSVLARVLDHLAAATARSPIALLSLGHCIPLQSALSQAQRLRHDIQRVARSDIEWLDVTSPIDWAAFPGVDPVVAAGLEAPAGWHPRLVSPRFHTLFGKAAYARLRRNRFQVHMQYLMAAERAGLYDYFAITAGTQRLRERFADEPTREPMSERACE